MTEENVGGRTMLEAGDAVRIRVRSVDGADTRDVRGRVKYTGAGGHRAELVVCADSPLALAAAVEAVILEPARDAALARARELEAAARDLYAAYEWPQRPPAERDAAWDRLADTLGLSPEVDGDG